MKTLFFLWSVLASSVLMASNHIARFDTLKSPQVTLNGVNNNKVVQFSESLNLKTIYKVHSSDDYEPLPDCSTLTENTWNPYPPEQGKFACFHINIKSNAILEFVAIDQTDSNQVNLKVYDDVLNNHSNFKEIGVSNSSSGIDYYKVFAEPGNYYAEFYSVSADNSNIRVAAVVNYEKADKFEDISPGKDYQGNDDAQKVYPVKNGSLIGGPAYLYPPEEVDNYEILNYWGQDLFVRVTPEEGEKNEFIIDLIVNDVAKPLEPGESYVLKDIEGDKIFVRVKSKNNGQLINSGRYIFEAGSKPEKIEDKTPNGDRAARVQEGTEGYQRVQNLKNFNWKAQVLDSLDKPIKNVNVHFVYRKSEHSEELEEEGTAGNDGTVNETFHLGAPCSGEYSVSYSSGLEIRYDKGRYRHFVRPAGFETESIFSGDVENWLRLCGDYESD